MTAMMTDAEFVVLGCGLALLASYGVIHLLGLEAIRRLRRHIEGHRFIGLLLTFWSLALLHLAEIAVAAVVLAELLRVPGLGSLSDGFGSSAADYLYFAGASFATLGYAQIEAHGAIRLLVMMIALSGFMLITWSATFLYTIWGENFRN